MNYSLYGLALKMGLCVKRDSWDKHGSNHGHLSTDL